MAPTLSVDGWYKGNLLWLPNRTIYLCTAGSHSYGTNIESSDVDIRGVCIPPKEYFLGFLHKFEQAESKEPYDAVVYDIRKFFKLAAACNPNIIELLFTDPMDWVIPNPFDSAISPWIEIIHHRDLFLSKKARYTFSGYAVSQLNRIKTHRRWLLNPPAKKPERLDYGLSPHQATIDKEDMALIESQIRRVSDTLGGEGFTKDKVQENEDELVVSVATKLNLSKDLFPLIIAERRYRAASHEWDQFMKWKDERNPVRSALEAKYGYDTKHASHLVRLMRMCTEIMETGVVHVKRPDAEELKAIRGGSWTYDELMEWAVKQDTELDETYKQSTLRNSPDLDKIDVLLVSVVERFL